MKRVALFASGNGSNAEAIVRYFDGHDRIWAAKLYCNNPNAGVLQRAKYLDIDTLVFNKNDLYNNGRVLGDLIEQKIDWIVLAGFLWLMPGDIIQQFNKKIINLHPALLPKYGGKGMYGMNVHRAVLENKERESGITIHLINEEYDSGPILSKYRIFVREKEDLTSLSTRIHQLEHHYYPREIEKIVLTN